MRLFQGRVSVLEGIMLLLMTSSVAYEAFVYRRITPIGVVFATAIVWYGVALFTGRSPNPAFFTHASSRAKVWMCCLVLALGTVLGSYLFYTYTW